MTKRWFSSMYYVRQGEWPKFRAEGSNGAGEDSGRRFWNLIHKLRDGAAILELSPMLERAVTVHGAREWTRVIRGFLRSVRDVVGRHGKTDCATVA